MSKRSHPGEPIVLVKYSPDTAKHIWRKMNAGEFEIERIPENYVSGYGRTEKVSRDLEKNTLD